MKIFKLKGCKLLSQSLAAVGSLTSREAHDVKDAVQLVVVVRVTGLYVLLATVEYGLRCQQLRKDAANRPDVWKGRAHTKAVTKNWQNMIAIGTLC